MRLAVVGRRIARRWWSTTNDGAPTLAGWGPASPQREPRLGGDADRYLVAGPEGREIQRRFGAE